MLAFGKQHIYLVWVCVCGKPKMKSQKPFYTCWKKNVKARFRGFGVARVGSKGGTVKKKRAFLKQKSVEKVQKL